MNEIPAKFIKQVATLNTPCNIWFGTVDSNGYGILCFGGVVSSAHRFFYENLVGDIPEGMTLDHICKNRRCVNPEHLEVVTKSENSRRTSKQWMLEQCETLRATANAMQAAAMMREETY